MIDFLTYLYSKSFISRTNFFAKIKVCSFFRFLIRLIINYLVPVYYKMGNLISIRQLGDKVKTKNNLIVSLTSFPARIKNVHIVIETILRQTILPEKIILWLSLEQFKSINELPKKLRRLIERGVDIRLCEGEDLRSYKKFYYTLKEYPNSDFIIIDDDVFYPSNLIENLLKYQEAHPYTVVFNRGYEVNVHKNEIQPYYKWKRLDKEVGPANNIMPTGMGGVLYPSGVLPEETLQKDIFMKHCRYADDIWLYSMVLYNGGKLIKTNDSRVFIPVWNKNNETLTSVNKYENLNDVQLAELDKYYKEVRGINLYKMLN